MDKQFPSPGRLLQSLNRALNSQRPRAAVQLDDNKENMASKSPKCQFCTEMKRKGKKDLPPDVGCTQCLLVKHKDMFEFKENVPDNSLDVEKKDQRLKRPYNKGRLVFKNEKPIKPQEEKEERPGSDKSSSSSDYMPPLYFNVSSNSDSSSGTQKEFAQLPVNKAKAEETPVAQPEIEEASNKSAIMVGIPMFELPPHIFAPQARVLEDSESSDESVQDEMTKTIIFKDDWFSSKVDIRKGKETEKKVAERTSNTSKFNWKEDEEELIFKLSLDENDLTKALNENILAKASVADELAEALAEDDQQVRSAVEEQEEELLDFSWMVVNANKDLEPILEYPVKLNDLEDALKPYEK